MGLKDYGPGAAANTTAAWLPTAVNAPVKVHMTALMRKLSVRNRTQAAIAARNLGWLRPTLIRIAD